MIELALRTIPVRAKINLADLDTIESSLLDPNSDFILQVPNIVLVLWRLEELAPNLFIDGALMSEKQRDEYRNSLINRINSLIKNFESRNRTPLFLSTFPPIVPLGRGLVDLHSQNGLISIRNDLNKFILESATNNPSVYIHDLDEWVSRIGERAMDLKMDFFARQPISFKHLPSFSLNLARSLTPHIRPSCRVLAIDLDNVIWGGVLGEEGYEKIKMGHDFPGNIYRQIQLAVIALKNQGVLITLLSKNNFPDVKEAFLKIPDMPLSLDDFVSIRVNWEPKSKNLISIAEELKLGIDSFAFLDDQDFEREEIKFSLPDVKVLEVSSDPISILKAIKNCPYFDLLKLSKEDKKRTNDYINQKKRKLYREKSSSFEEYLYSLNLEAETNEVNGNNMSRVIQMLSKTNQFNLTSYRHAETEVNEMLKNDINILIVLSVKDRFGDQGIVGLAIALTKGDSIMEVDTFLLSCRALGRGIEKALWKNLIERLTDKGCKELKARYIPNKKNIQCEKILDNFGMKLLGTDKIETDKNCIKNYTTTFPCYFENPDWIKLRSSNK
jgi:FkbH-like protein